MSAVEWINWVSTFVGAESEAGLWAVMGLLALATLLSEDLTCVAAGLLVAAGRIDMAAAVASCFVGIVLGDLALAGIGRGFGAAALGRWPLRGRVSEKSLGRAKEWFSNRGGVAILVSRFLPGTRLPLYLAAGVLRAPWAGLVGWFALAAGLWVPLLVWSSRLLGEAALVFLSDWTRLVGAGAGLILAGWLVGRLVRSVITWRGRRLWWSRWFRLSRWEFWPGWAIYPPVVAYMVWLGLRHGGMAVCTAANPGIGAAGGLVGESKSEILSNLEGSGRVARWVLVEPGDVHERMRGVVLFQEAARSRGEPVWPLVLKPDKGERGRGVVIARTVRELEEKLAGDGSALIVQEYVSGVEFGLFYIRRPGANSGELFAITEKRTLAVEGDGVSTLETLILRDARAVAMAPYFFREYAGRMEEVVERGRSFVLAELGTHCRGAVFLDGRRLATPELVAAVCRVSEAAEGINFGRYDVRTQSIEALGRGEFTVIELNGLTSEATSIYDPKHGLLHAWRTLCRQWEVAYLIGRANRERGARVWRLGEVWNLWRESNRKYGS